MTQKICLPSTTMYLGMYTTGILVSGEHSWMLTMLCNTEAEAIGHCLSMINVEHIRIIAIPGMPRYGVPDTLKTISNLTGEVIDYAESEDSGQHQSECDRTKPDSENRKISSV